MTSFIVPVFVSESGRKSEKYMSRDMTKPIKGPCFRPVWSESSLSLWKNIESLIATHWAHSDDSDQTGRLPGLIWVFAGRTLILFVLSCRGSHYGKVFQILLKLKLYSVSLDAHTTKIIFTVLAWLINIEMHLLDKTWTETRQANLCLRAFRHDKF